MNGHEETVPMNHEAAHLAKTMRREADALCPGPPPVDAVVRAGRRRRRHRRRAVAGVTAATVLGCLVGALVPLSLPPSPPPSERPVGTPPATATASPTPSGEPTSSGVRVVRPYEPVEIGQGALLGLLPEGRQNHIVTWGGRQAFDEEIEWAKGLPGDGIRPNSLSGGYHYSPESGVLYRGTWRTDTEPARITVTAAGRTWEANLVRLPGDPGWGVYHLDAGHLDRDDVPATVTAHGPDGTVLARLDGMTAPMR
ncbi:hypothetical protein F0L17_13730 [Streptomyces sp. TRM43335]|uniref:Uncharacterized protein n=1 Tax=Streptomyces taklimakanensis TaxID=2569853 RepID=A0A6G2BCZ6_9ACTN|nr:hypothetical protein [Streptomyces taklimakanensis]MTE20151.1 hypothetical protein [Streptomyces taklimakanensis]